MNHIITESNILEGIEKCTLLSQHDCYVMARDILSPYILRGDTIQQTKEGQMGCTLEDFCGWFNIGGRVNGVNYGTDKVLIELRDGRLFVFKLKDIYDSFNNKQDTLF